MCLCVSVCDTRDCFCVCVRAEVWLLCTVTVSLHDNLSVDDLTCIENQISKQANLIMFLFRNALKSNNMFFNLNINTSYI